MDSAPDERHGPVLVTGATGFIGRHVARRLLGAGRHVVALARPRDGEPPSGRVARAIGTGAGGRLDVVAGDLAEPGGGLAAAALERLRATVETVVHCAGDTSFFPEEPARFRAGHVEGPCVLLRALAGGRLRRWGHLSTAYVCGARSGTVLESERDVGQVFRNPYERVKLEAETAIRAAGEQAGVDVRIFRPSIVVGGAAETAGAGPSNLFVALVRLGAGLARLAGGAEMSVRLPVAPSAPLNLVPLPYVSAAVAALADLPGAAGATVHLVVADPPVLAAVLELITARLGLRGVSAVDPRRGPLERPTPLEQRLDRMLAGYRGYLAQDVRFDDANARRLLEPLGVASPALSAPVLDGLIAEALAAPEYVG